MAEMTISVLIQNILLRFRSEFPLDDGYQVIFQLNDYDMQLSVGVKCADIRHAVVVIDAKRPLHDHMWGDWEVGRMAAQFERDAPLMIARFWQVFHEHKKPFLSGIAT